MGFRDNLAAITSWSEPSFVKRLDRGVQWVPKWFHAVSAAIFLLFVTIAFLTESKDESPWMMVYIGAGIAIWCYLIPIFNAYMGAHIWLDTQGVTIMNHPFAMQAPILMLFKVGVHEIEWKKIASITLHEKGEIAGRPVRVLEFTGHDGLRLARVGVSRKPTAEKLGDVLARNGRDLAVV